MRKPKRLLFFIPTILLLSVLFLAIVAFFGLEYYATTAVKQEIDNNIEELSQYVEIEYDSMRVNWLAFTVNLNQVKLSKPPLPGMITIDKVSVRDLTSIGITWIPTVVIFDNIFLTNEETSLGAQRLSTTFTLKNVPSQEELANDWTVLWENLLTGSVNIERFSLADKNSQLQVSAKEFDYALDKKTPRSSSLKVSDLNFHKQDLQFHFDAFHLAVSLDRNNLLTHLVKQIRNFSVQFPRGLAAQHPFFHHVISLGYDRLVLGLDLNYDYQPESKELSASWDASAANMGQMQVDLRLSDFATPPMPLEGGLVRFLNFFRELSTPPEKASLRSLKVRYQDFGLVPRLIKAEAQSRHLSAEDFTRNLVGTINTTLLILPIPASLKDQIKSVNRFLLNPGEIQVAITCKEPVRLENLGPGSLMGLIDLLSNAEVKITAK
jgi:hypothetical protein